MRRVLSSDAEQLCAVKWGGDLPREWVAYRHFRAACSAKQPLDHD